MDYKSDSDIVLSVLVISHNQRHLISRCLNSILEQKLNVPYEVIVSDDRSTDGTWELIEEYAKKYSDIIRGVKCNSDECNPVNNSERCGWNKATAYKHSRGKFFVNVDADDYLKSDDIYQKQLDALMSNPDCSMCQQRIWQVNDGEPLELGYAWPNHQRLKDGAKLAVADIIQQDLQGLNPTYMIRKNNGENPAEKFGKWFNDTNITLYYLQFGNVIFIDRADYVWVQYHSSISNSVKGWDYQLLHALLPLQQALLIPSFKNYFLARYNRELAGLLKQSLLRRIHFDSGVIAYYAQLDGFIFRYYAKGQRGIGSRVRIARALLQYYKIQNHPTNSQKGTDKLYSLLIK